jgi:hypothetical protein
LIFLDVPTFGGGVGLTIHIRTKIRYDYSYIASAAVRIGPEDTLQVASFGDYLVNGVVQAELPIRLADSYPVTYKRLSDKEHQFEIQLNEQEHIVLTAFKDMVNIKMEDATYASFGLSKGLMGTFGTGTRMARNGTLEFSKDDPNGFVEDWQVRDTDPQLFQSISGPQYPDRCILPNPDEPKEARRRRRRLGDSEVTKDAATKACAHWDNQDACIFDVMATGDLDLADMTPY